MISSEYDPEKDSRISGIETFDSESQSDNDTLHTKTIDMIKLYFSTDWCNIRRISTTNNIITLQFYLGLYFVAEP